jgi:hypothetical protein
MLHNSEFLEWIFNEFCLNSVCNHQGNLKTSQPVSSLHQRHVTDATAQSLGRMEKFLTAFLIGGWGFQIPFATNLDILTHIAYPSSCGPLIHLLSYYVRFNTIFRSYMTSPFELTRLCTQAIWKSPNPERAANQLLRVKMFLSGKIYSIPTD